MEINFYAILTAAFSSLLIGFIWYHPKVFGTIWMKVSDTTEEKMKNSNMIALFSLSFFFAVLISMIINVLVIHQYGALGMIGGELSAAKPSYAAFMADYGTTFRTFKHGALHGFMTGIFLALPLLGTNALYERKGWKYILINGGYWIVTFTLMGAIICGWA